MKQKLWLLGACLGAGRTFGSMFKDMEILPYNAFNRLKEIKNGDVVMYGGGEDISPMLYNEKPSRYSHAINPSYRDRFESEAFKIAIKNKAYNFGICRGAQLVCALSGGKLVQHITGHGGDHWIKTNKGEMYRTSSVHHQMMYPWDIDHVMIAISAPPQSDFYILNDNNVVKASDMKKDEPEIVWFPETMSLGIQGHPEFMAPHDPFVLYSKRLVKEHFPYEL